MRVGTDGVLLGAWTDVSSAQSILDIGTGTGVIALMLAQRSTAIINAIDIDAGAIQDATDNFEQSPWKNRLTASQISLQEFSSSMQKKYDCIVSNPPFFTSAQKPKQNNRLMARHTDSLSFDDLLINVGSLLLPRGKFSVVLPAEEEHAFQHQAGKYRLFLTRIIRVKPNPEKPITRVLMEFQTEGKLISEDELTLETTTRHEYTKTAIELLKPFYLYL